jgi:hypothetical protein
MITKYKNIHKGSPIIICALGSSLNEIDKKVLENYITIGVNDIERVYTPDYCIFQDNLNFMYNFIKNNHAINKDICDEYIKASQSITNFKSKKMFLHLYDQNIQFFPKNKRKDCVDLLINNISIPSALMGNVYNKDIIYYSCTSPIIAFSLAVYMGSRAIGFVGFDLNGKHAFGYEIKHHIDVFNRILPKVEEFFGRALYLLKDVKAYNFSPKSIITSIPKKDPSEIESLLPLTLT